MFNLFKKKDFKPTDYTKKVLLAGKVYTIPAGEPEIMMKIGQALKEQAAILHTAAQDAKEKPISVEKLYNDCRLVCVGAVDFILGKNASADILGDKVNNYQNCTELLSYVIKICNSGRQEFIKAKKSCYGK